MIQTQLRIGIVVLALFFLGCGTPEPIRNQSTVTAAKIGHITAELKRLAAEEKRLMDVRARRVIDLHAVVEDVKERRTNRLTGKSKALFKSVWKKVDEAEKRWTASRVREAEIRKKVEEGAKTYSVPAVPLVKAQQLLATLGEEDDRKAQMKFLWGFLKATGTSFKEQKKESEKKAADATKEADKNVKEMKSNLKANN